ncbi:MAG: hypothetical protein K2K97_05435, partial [Muribaculaceae bacterium]|nr:hypothetical protein [Muribaculaceae bacterium]
MLTDKDLDLLYQAICHDSYFPPKRTTFNKLIEKAEEVSYKVKKYIVEYGQVDSSVWIVGQGVTCLAYYKEDK